MSNPSDVTTRLREALARAEQAHRGVSLTLADARELLAMSEQVRTYTSGDMASAGGLAEILQQFHPGTPIRALTNSEHYSHQIVEAKCKSLRFSVLTGKLLLFCGHTPQETYNK